MLIAVDGAAGSVLLAVDLRALRRRQMTAVRGSIALDGSVVEKAGTLGIEGGQVVDPRQPSDRSPICLTPPAAPADGRVALELIKLERAEIGYQKPLLPPFDLSVRSGERLAVLGPNGGGKSTLLKSLIGLLPLLSGRRVFPIGRMPRSGYVPQVHRVDPVYPLTSLQVVLQGRYGLIGLGRFPKGRDRLAAFAQLEKVGMAHVASEPFRSLSGGQRQRILLARALCGEPELLVLDEFTSDLDPVASAALLAEVAELADREKVSVIFVTHEISSAAIYSTEVAMMDARRGVFATGRSEQLLTAEALSRLYGQNVSVERRGDRTVVFVESGRPR